VFYSNFFSYKGSLGGGARERETEDPEPADEGNIGMEYSSD